MSGGVDPRLARQLDRVVEERADLELQLADPEVLADPARLRVASKRYAELGPLVEAIARRTQRVDDASVALELIDASTDPDERAMLQAEHDTAMAELPEIEHQIRELLVPRDPNDGRDVILEIRGAEGGEEANLFARDLAEMYEAYADRKGWRIETLSSSITDMGGFDTVTFLVSGDDAWRHLKFEGGPHRVQRVPITESQGRIHTSSATVTVLAEVDDVDVDLDERDVDVDVYRSSGAGGQHVNTTDSAVRLTHRPTGIVVTMQDERSQLQNRQRAMRVLRARIHDLAQSERSASMSAERRAQTGSGGRSEKIRTYNFKENRVTDHRLGLTLYRLGDVLGGDLDPVVGPLGADERARLLAAGDESATDLPSAGGSTAQRSSTTPGPSGSSRPPGPSGSSRPPGLSGSSGSSGPVRP